MNHAPGAGSIARPVDQQSSALPLSYGHPLAMSQTVYHQFTIMYTINLQPSPLNLTEYPAISIDVASSKNLLTPVFI